MMRKAAFFDRDGVINIDHAYHLAGRMGLERLFR